MVQSRGHKKIKLLVILCFLTGQRLARVSYEISFTCDVSSQSARYGAESSELMQEAVFEINTCWVSERQIDW